ncbi:hypothetical protein [Xanthobacter sediminis]
MTGSIIERFGTSIDDVGDIHHDDRPCSWERGDELAGRWLDRRRVYAVIDGEVCDLVTWSAPCSGCCEGLWLSDAARGAGCRECGFTGRRRRAQFVPARLCEID